MLWQSAGRWRLVDETAGLEAIRVPAAQGGHLKEPG